MGCSTFSRVFISKKYKFFSESTRNLKVLTKTWSMLSKPILAWILALLAKVARPNYYFLYL